MRLRTPSGDLPFRLMTFPDGQRHVELLSRDNGGWGEVTIETSIQGMDDLFDLLLMKDVLDMQGYVAHLNVRYLLGARMDRRISSMQPFTLQIVARLINGAGFRRVRVLDPHSSVSCQLLGAEAVYPLSVIDQVLARYVPSQTVILVPDKGAVQRVETLLSALPGGERWTRTQCDKRRDMNTGRLSGFVVPNGSYIKGRSCLILDDICDGGGTFTGLAQEALEHGAASVDLFVTHGIFSKGLPLPYIQTVYTTDSYRPTTEEGRYPDQRAIAFPVEMTL